MLDLLIMGASVPGTRHTLPGSPAWKNNQDAFFWRTASDGSVVAVVCDGCSAGDRSEVGAQLVAMKLVDIVEHKLATHPTLELPWKTIKKELVAYLAAVAEPLGLPIAAVVEQCFLSTIVGAVVTTDTVIVFSIGDGVWATDGMFYTLGPFPENKPPYLAYSLTGSTVTDFNPELLEFAVETIVNPEINTVIIGSDGLQDFIRAHVEGACYPGTEKSLCELEKLFSPEFFSNPDNLRRHLALMNRETARNGKIISGLLPDDTTAVMIHRFARVETRLQSPKEIYHE